MKHRRRSENNIFLPQQRSLPLNFDTSSVVDTQSSRFSLFYSKANLVSSNELRISNRSVRLESLGLNISFAQNQAMKQKYYDLRQKAFDEVDRSYCAKNPQDCGDWEDYDGSEMIDDICGKILVVVDDFGNLVAGARFLLSDAINFTSNEDPKSGFTIRKFLSEKGFNSAAKYCEIDDVVIEKKYRDHELLKAIFGFLISEAKNSGCEYMIGIAIRVACRNDKMLFAAHNQEVKIFYDYPWIKQKNRGYETRFPIITKLS